MDITSAWVGSLSAGGSYWPVRQWPVFNWWYLEASPLFTLAGMESGFCRASQVYQYSFDVRPRLRPLPLWSRFEWTKGLGGGSSPTRTGCMPEDPHSVGIGLVRSQLIHLSAFSFPGSPLYWSSIVAVGTLWRRVPMRFLVESCTWLGWARLRSSVGWPQFLFACHRENAYGRSSRVTHSESQSLVCVRAELKPSSFPSRAHMTFF